MKFKLGKINKFLKPLGLVLVLVTEKSASGDVTTSFDLMSEDSYRKKHGKSKTISGVI